MNTSLWTVPLLAAMNTCPDPWNVPAKRLAQGETLDAEQSSKHTLTSPQDVLMLMTPSTEHALRLQPSHTFLDGELSTDENSLVIDC